MESRDELRKKYISRINVIGFTFMAGVLSLPLIVPLCIFSMEFRSRIGMWVMSLDEELAEMQEFFDDEENF